VVILGPMDAFCLSVYTKEDLKIRLSVANEWTAGTCYH
jgi:hypothetical protein